VDRVDELYARSPDEFVAARNDLAKELKAGGDADAAADVRALRRPSVVAWAINQAVRAQPQALQDLLSAGAALRRVHSRLVAGKVDREALRTATEDERAAVTALAAATAEAAQAARRPLGPGGMDKVRETLHAAALDDDVRAALEAGRLEREASASGTGFATRAAAGPAPAPRPRAKSEGARERRLEREAAAEAVRDTTRDLRTAEREAELRARQAELAENAAEAAREALSTAEAELEVARAQLAEGQRTLRKAKAASAAAQARLDAAQGRLLD
jgi:hypothetical protein